MAEKFANATEFGAPITLTTGVDMAVTSFPVSAVAPLSLRGGTSRWRIGNELILMTIPADGTSPWTGVRGAEGSTAAAHATGTAVKHRLTAAVLTDHETRVRLDTSPAGGLTLAARLLFATSGQANIDQSGGTGVLALRTFDAAGTPALQTRLSIATGNTPTHNLQGGQWVVKSAADTQIPLVARVFSNTQSVDLQQWQTSTAGAVGSRMSKDGLYGHNTAPANALHALGGGGRIQIVANPSSAPVVTPQGTPGSTTYNYWIVGRDTASAAGKTLASPVGTTATGAATLNATNFNRITGTITQAKTVDILRGATLATAVSVATGLALTSGNYTFDDVGGATAAYTVPTRNTTGDFTIDGKLTHISSFEFNPLDYNAVRSDTSTHDAAFLACFNAAIAVNGTVRIPYNASLWKFSTTLDLLPASGGSMTVHVIADGPFNMFGWTGANNSSMFRTRGLKRSRWSGIKVAVNTAKTGIVAFDFDVDATRGSTGVNVIEGCSVSAVDATCTGCIGFRVFHGTTGSEASAWKFDSCAVSWPQADPAAGGCLGWSIQGANTIQNVWVNCVNVGCFEGFSFAGDAAQPQGGQASAETFIGCGGSGNAVEFALKGQSGFLCVIGGRFEAGYKVMTTGGSADVAIGISWVGVTFARMGNGDISTTHGTDVVFTLDCPVHMTFDCCNWYDIKGDGTGTNYGPPMFTLNSGSTTFGSLRFTNCSIPAPDTGFWTVVPTRGDWDIEIARGNIRTDMTDYANGSRARQMFTPRNGPVVAMTPKTAPYTVTARDRHVLVDTTAGAVTITLPAATIQNQVVTVKDAGGAAATNNVTVARAGADTIDGSTTNVINAGYGARTYWSNGAGKWSVI